MKNNKLEAFKAKANAVLLNEALLNINGGMDAEACHPNGPQPHGYLKADLGYSPIDVDRFFARPDLAQQFDAMYAPGDENIAEQRMVWFDSIVAACPPQG